MTAPRVWALAPDGVPEVGPGDDLAALLLEALAATGETLRDGDVVVVTSKVVSKAEDRVVDGDREGHLAAATDRVVARRGPTTIVRTHHGLIMAAGGIDSSNVERGRSVLLPVDPDASARRLRADLAAATGARLGVVVTDTAGRAWREGQTDIAIGAAGVLVAEDFAGRLDAHGNELAVTAPAVADEIAGLAELAQGKLAARPFAVVRGRADLVLAPNDDGPGARALVRAEGGDLFGFGAREAVVRALRGDPADQHVFGAPVPAAEMAALLPAAVVLDAGEVRCPAAPGEEAAARRADLTALAFAHGWRLEAAGAGTDDTGDTDLRFHPTTP